MVAGRLGTAPVAALETVFGRWDEAVGPVEAVHCRPLSLDGPTLVVAVDESGWASALRSLGPQLLRRLEEVGGMPVAERLEVRVRPPSRPSG